MSVAIDLMTRALGAHAALLSRADLREVSANPDGRLFVDCTTRGLVQVGELGSRERNQIVRLCASEAGRLVTADSPIVSCRLPGLGHRFEGLVPPAVSEACFSIRFHGSDLRSLDDYAREGTVTGQQCTILREAIARKRNLLVAGATGSGKTTLLNALISEIARELPGTRVVVIEDTPEIRTGLDNVVFLQTSPGADATRLLASTLRLRPDRILVGEVRDGAALALLKAWNTGHPGGLASLHANSAADALTRLDLLVREASSQPLPEVIAAAVDLVVFIERTRDGRRVTEILEVEGYDHGRFRTHKLA